MAKKKTFEELMEEARGKMQYLNFDECIELYERLDRGNPMISIVFERMEEIDPERFERWL